MTVARSIKAQLDEAEFVIRQQMIRIAELEQENERLKAGLDAHGTLQAIYRNPASPEGNRIKAAAAALPHETPKLTSVPPALDLTAQEVVPLAQLVEQRRKRQQELQGQPIEIVPDASAPGGQRVNLLAKPNGDGGGE